MRQIQIAINPKLKKQIKHLLSDSKPITGFKIGEEIEILTHCLPGRIAIELRIINSINGPVVLPAIMIKGVVVAIGATSKKLSNLFQITHGGDKFEIKVVTYKRTNTSKIRDRCVCEICQTTKEYPNRI